MSSFVPGLNGIQNETLFRESVKEILKQDPLFDGFKVANQYANLTNGGVNIEKNSTTFLSTILPTLITFVSICEHNENHLVNGTLPLSKVFRGDTLEPIILLGCMIHIIITKFEKDDPNFVCKLLDLLSKNMENNEAKFLISERFYNSTPEEKLSTIFHYLSLFVHRKAEEGSLKIADDYLYIKTRPSRVTYKQEQT